MEGYTERPWIKFVPAGVVIVMFLSGLLYLRFQASNQDQPQTVSLEPTPALGKSYSVDIESRLLIIEKAVLQLAKQGNQVSGNASNQGTAPGASFESRLKSLENSMASLQRDVLDLKKQGLTPTPAVASSKADIYIPLGTSLETNGRDYASLDSVIVSLDPADFPGYSGIQLELSLKSNETVGTAYVRLYNETDQSAVAGSEVSASTDKYTLLTSSSFKLAAGRKTYRLQVKSTQGYQVYLQNARLKVSF